MQEEKCKMVPMLPLDAKEMPEALLTTASKETS